MRAERRFLPAFAEGLPALAVNRDRLPAATGVVDGNGLNGGRAQDVASSSAMKSNAAPSGPLALPSSLRQRALRITSASALCCRANEQAIAASRAPTSAPLFVL